MFDVALPWALCGYITLTSVQLQNKPTVYSFPSLQKSPADASWYDTICHITEFKATTNAPHCGALNKTLSTVTLWDVNTQGVGHANWLLGSEEGAIPLISPNDDDDDIVNNSESVAARRPSL